MELLDTIAAISTPHGKGGVALLRVSGAEALSVASRVFVPKNGKALQDLIPRMATYGAILAPEGDTWQPVDDGIATVFRAPASFTGEDTVEITCHGGILLTQTVLSALLSAGARLAHAGEFTRRAFLNGKLGLAPPRRLDRSWKHRAAARWRWRLADSTVSWRRVAECAMRSCVRF